MNILVTVSSLEIGGAEKQSVTAANMLAKEHRVYFVAFSDGELASSLDDGIQYQVMNKRNYLLAAVRLARFCRRHQIEVIHSHLFAAMIISALASLLCPAKVFWTFHGHRYESENRGRWTLKLLSRLKGVRKLFFVSEELIDYYAGDAYDLPQQKVKLVYNSIDKVKRNLPISSDSDKVIIGFVGRLVELKRADRLVDAARFLLYHGVSDFEIWIVGDGDKRLALEERIRSECLHEHVRLYGFQKDIAPYYSKFDVFALPSDEEGLSLSLIEAGMYGVPAVAFDVGGNREIIHCDRTGFVVRNDFQFRERLLTLVLDADLRHKLGKAARRSAGKNFSPKRHLTELESAFSGSLV